MNPTNPTPQLSLRRVRSTDGDDFSFALSLLITAFPRDEYRDPEAWAALTCESEAFSNNLILHGNERVGLLTLWKFAPFVYVEHFAIDASLRGQGLGRHVMEKLLNKAQQPLVLEVEMPETDMARRRIAFYERCGLKLLAYPYVQPPYRTDGQALPMRVMCTHALSQNEFERVRQTLYSRVYGYNDSANSN